MGERRLQCDRTAVRVPDQVKALARRAKYRLEKRDLVVHREGSPTRPGRALPVTIEIDGDDAKGRRKPIHERTPLPGRASARMKAYDGRARSGLPEKRTRCFHATS